MSDAAHPVLKIAPELSGHIAEWADFIPNPWNPNRMDAWTRSKLVSSLKADGFFIPLLVRPHPTLSGKWEIIDGEQRWTVAGDEYGKPALPFVNAGAISDSHAKTLTARTNGLKGEWDAIALAKMVNEVATDMGMAFTEELMPFTPERLRTMIEMDQADVVVTPEMLNGSMAADNSIGGGASDNRGEFRSFDPNTEEFDHKCPRCKLEFND